MSDLQPVGGLAPSAENKPTLGKLWVLLQQPAFQGNEWMVLACATLLTTLLFSLFFLVATPGYETNDDLCMQCIASGMYTGQPSEYLVFTNVLIGLALRLLYGLWTGNNWYFIYLVSVHFLSLTTICFVVLSRNRSWFFILLCIGFFLLVEMRILIDLQFTTTAFLAGAAGVVALADGLEPGRRIDRPKIVAGILLITLMGMVREAVVPFLGIVAFPFLLERFGLRGWRRMIWAAMACGSLFILMHAVNRWYYERDPSWAEYLEYNTLRGQLQDTPLTAFASRSASAAGWSTNDAAMFVNFYFSEPEVFAGTSRLRRFVEASRSFVEPGMFVRRFSMKWLFLPQMLDRDSRILLNLALLNGLWCLAGAGSSRSRYVITLTLMYAGCVLIAFYLRGTARLPPRVAYNMPLFLNLACLYWATGVGTSKAATNAHRNLFSLLRYACVLGWLVLYGSLVYEVGRSLWYANAYYRRLQRISGKVFEPTKRLLPEGERPVFIALPHNSVLERCLLYRHEVQTLPFSIVPYGWLTHSPLFRQALSRRQLDPYSLSLVGRRDVFFLMETRWLEPLRLFYREHYGLDIAFETVLDTDAMPEYRDCRLHLYKASVFGENKPTRPAASAVLP